MTLYSQYLSALSVLVSLGAAAVDYAVLKTSDPKEEPYAIAVKSCRWEGDTLSIESSRLSLRIQPLDWAQQSQKLLFGPGQEDSPELTLSFTDRDKNIWIPSIDAPIATHCEISLAPLSDTRFSVWFKCQDIYQQGKQLRERIDIAIDRANALLCSY